MLLSRLSENFIIENLLKIVQVKLPENIMIGPGDDCAVISVSKNRYLAITTDMLVEDVHFRVKNITPQRLGEKALAVNLSDLAAMGAEPLGAVISLGLPLSLEFSFVKKIYQGLRKVSISYNCPIIGGDTVRSDEKIVICITVIGMITNYTPLTRCGAKPGDLIFTTGYLGDSGAGLEILDNMDNSQWEKNSSLAFLVRRHWKVKPRLREGKVLSKMVKATTAIDLSDGLARDIGNLCRMSDTGALIDVASLPISKALKKSEPYLKNKPLFYALYGGEDYELLFTLNPDKKEILFQKFKQNSLRQPFFIGTMLKKEKGIFLKNENGKLEELVDKSWQHFGSPR